MKGMYIIPIFIPHLGCPFKCVFCNQNAITGHEEEITEKYVRHTIESHLKTIPKDARVEVSFFGGSFTGIPIEKQSMYLGIAKEYLDKGQIDAIRLSTRPDYINPEILENLKRYNASIIELGVQSMDDEVLLKSRRGHSSLDVINAVKLIRQYDFKLGLQIMISLPGDDLDKSLNTAQKIVQLKPDFVRIYPTLVIKGTYLEKMYKDGRYKPLNLEETVEISKRLYIIFLKNDVEVIRIGLQPTENISYNGDVVAGPFHPAMGQLVESRVILDVLMKIFEEKNIRNTDVSIISNEKRISTVIGQKKHNKQILENKYNVNAKFKMSQKIPYDMIVLCYYRKIMRICINDYVKNNF
ncbi:histone acetyltransferase [Thermoanaerobacter kivui]|uniref:Histone acetyltransferase n=1 Tax=Thermoanaerobacter kivui TaxID=2325 RepID=A0A097ARV3_THEKI|nr:radical SAM protein [Thermoanaerobacter kivui]AIS52555.1 histone acetyltransferase [Thermoanaerobacter kivui]